MSTQPPDVVGAYADVIRLHLADRPDVALTVPELCDALKLSDRLVRMGLDRLAFCRAVQMTQRHKPHQRGAPPWQYQWSQS